MNIKFTLIVCSIYLFALSANAQTIHSWLTAGNQSVLLEKQADIQFEAVSGNSTVTIDPTVRDQEIDGFGFTFTEGSAEVIATLPESEQDQLLNELFNKVTGLGQEVVRIGIGATDLSSSSYTYHDNGPDASLSSFSLSGPDLIYLIPLLKKVVAINPDVKFLATPWTAPKWMKTVDTWNGSQLQPQYYGVYANYFLKYFEAMRNEGIEIWAITPQNEPLHGGNNPSMEMSSTEQIDFINNHLGPLLANSTFSPKIIAYDHNLDHPEYPIDVCNSSSYVDGGAFHLYGGDISAMSTFRNATGKNAYFTEQYTGSEGSFEWDMRWHMMNVFFGSLFNGARTVLQWNLAGDENHGPHTIGGCTTCLGALTINSSTKQITRNVSYYNVAHFSKFVQSGAIRIAATSTDAELLSVAFENPTGENVLVVYNSGDTKSFSVQLGQKQFSYSIPTRSVVSFTWFPEAASSSGFATVYESCQFEGHHVGLGEGSYSLSDLFDLGVYPGELRSLSVITGFEIDVFEHDDFVGDSLNISSQEACLNLGVFNDNDFSIKVRAQGEEGISGRFFIRNHNSGLYMEILAGSLLDGANIIQQEFSGNEEQLFEFVEANRGVYTIRNVNSGLVLDIQDVSTVNGGNVQQWTDFQAKNQQFIVVETDTPPYYQLVARHSGLVVDVASSSISPGANVQQWGNQWDWNGEWELAVDEVTSLESISAKSAILNCYPSPAAATLTVETDIYWNVFTIDVFDQFGRVVATVQNANEINVSHLPAGIYMVELRSANHSLKGYFSK